MIYFVSQRPYLIPRFKGWSSKKCRMLHCNFLSSCKSYCRKRKCHLHSGSSHFYKDVCVSVCACTLLNYQKAMYTNADTEALTVTATYRVEVRWDQGEREMLSQRQKYVGENTLHTFFTKLCEGVVSTKPKKSLRCLNTRVWSVCLWGTLLLTKKAQNNNSK